MIKSYLSNQHCCGGHAPHTTMQWTGDGRPSSGHSDKITTASAKVLKGDQPHVWLWLSPGPTSPDPDCDPAQGRQHCPGPWRRISESCPPAPWGTLAAAAQHLHLRGIRGNSFPAHNYTLGNTQVKIFGSIFLLITTRSFLFCS